MFVFTLVFVPALVAIVAVAVVVGVVVAVNGGVWIWMRVVQEDIWTRGCGVHIVDRV